MTAAAPLETAPATLPALAREHLRASSGNARAASASLLRTLLADRAALRAVIEAAVRDAVVYRVESAVRHRRAAVIASAERDRKGAVIALARGISASLLDMPLAGGVRLGDATRDQVTEQADRYEAISSDTGRKARWLRLIAQSVPPGRIVSDVMDADRAAELLQEATV